MDGAISPLSAVTDRESSTILEQELKPVNHLRARSIVGLDRRLSAYCTSSTVEEIDIRFADGTELPIIFKNLDAGAMIAPANSIRPLFLYNPQREIEVYRHLLAPSPLDTATCYGAVSDPMRDRYWLFLERVPGLQLRHVGDLKIWKQAAAWLARMHLWFAESDKMSPTAARHLLTCDVESGRRWIGRAVTFLNELRTLTAAEDRTIRRLATRYDSVLDRLQALPTTLIHGDFYPSNVLVHQGPQESRVCAIDWEMAAVGPGLIDLAALTGGTWQEDDRLSVARAYRQIWSAGGIPWREAAFLEALDCAHLYLAVQWLGWASGWSPEPDHAHGWLAEVTRLVERLRL